MGEQEFERFLALFAVPKLRDFAPSATYSSKSSRKVAKNAKKRKVRKVVCDASFGCFEGKIIEPLRELRN
jgi:hypothetical protein